jgi:GNAT superfamily N-acetyltransferase
MNPVQFSDSDDIGELTELLNTAYKRWEDKGFRYLASHQTADITRERIVQGKCFIMKENARMIATITYYPPLTKTGHEIFLQTDVATYGQLAVLPAFQNKGVASGLISFTEELARQDNAKRMIIDTAENNTELVSYYLKKGYIIIGRTSWPTTNYTSVFMQKTL